VADERARTGSLYQKIRRLVTVRGSYPAEFGPNEYRSVDAGSSSVLGFWRDGPWARVLCLYNFSREPAQGAVALEPEVQTAPEVIAGETTGDRTDSTLSFSLGSRRFAWLLFHPPKPGDRSEGKGSAPGHDAR
jgi:hypothetical protein